MNILKKERINIRNFFMKKKKAMEIGFIGKLLISLLVAAIVLVAYGIISGRGVGIIDRITNYFRFGMFILSLS